jgi:VWFA-related protein
MRSWLAALPIVAAIAVALSAQQPPAQQPPPQQPPQPSPAPPTGQQPPTFRAGTALVRVDVTVSDKKGEPLESLTKDDFVVAEDGVPQPIETFKFIEASGVPTDDLSLPIRSQDHARAEAARDDIRVFVIFWDEYHIGQMDPAIRAREALTKFVQTAFGPTDLVALVDQLTPGDAIEFTRDRSALVDRIRRLQGRKGVYLPVRSAMEEAQMYSPGGIEQIRAQVTGGALQSTIAYLGTIKEGRKELLFVSDDIGPIGGFGFSGLSGRNDWLRDTLRMANANNVAIYAMDPRGVGPVTSDVLMSLALDTGGKVIRGNQPGSMLPQIVRDASAFYLLGYHTSAPVDGKWHKISVKVNKPGVEVHARQGYFAPSVQQMVEAREKAAEAEVEPDVGRALTLLAGESRDNRATPTVIADEPIAGVILTGPVVFRAQTPLELRQLQAAADPQAYTGHAFTRTDRMLLRFALQGEDAGDAKVTVRLLGRGGKPLTELPIAPRGPEPNAYQLDLPLGNVAPGTYMVEVAVARGQQRTRTLYPFELK